MSDLQAKYDALMRLYIGDQAQCSQSIMNELHKDMDTARHAKYKRQMEMRKSAPKFDAVLVWDAMGNFTNANAGKNLELSK